MSKSLQDQLLALGMANEKAKQAAGGELSLDRAYALRQQEEKKQANTARKRKQAQDRQRRQLNTQIRAIVSKYRLNDSKAEVSRHFMYRGRIRKINLTPDQQKALNAAELGIAYLSGSYHLLAPEHIEAVRKLSAEHIPDLTSGQTEEENEYPIPDDLTW